MRANEGLVATVAILSELHGRDDEAAARTPGWTGGAATGTGRCRASAKEILDAIVQGYRSEAWKAKLLALDAKKEQLDAALRVPELPARHLNMEQVYRDKATALAAGLERQDERDGTRQALRGFIEKIVIPPNGLLQVVGNLGAMLAAAQGRALSYEDRCGIVGCGGGI